jgi:hypothetical protein
MNQRNVNLTTFKRLFLSVIAIGLIYLNLAVLFDETINKYFGFHPPVPKGGYNALIIFGVFNRYDTNNEQLTIWGLATNQQTKASYWKELPAREFVPFTCGERNSRLWADMHYRNLGRQGHWETWQAMGRKILARHNRLHPEDPISQVSLQSLTWPRSPDGFYALQSRATRRQFFIMAEHR